MTSTAWSQTLGEIFAGHFPTEPRAWRQVGREGEYPIVHGDGTAADISELWELLAAEGQVVHREGELITALEEPDVTFSSEVGKGTMEIIIGPHRDLHGSKATYEKAMERLVNAAACKGLYVLGQGIHPVTPASLPLMTGKHRYHVLLEALGDPWLWFTTTSADQVHLEVSRHEVLAVTNVANLLAPVTVALTANSGVFGGKDAGVCSAREAMMGTIHHQGHRHGMTEGAVESFDRWIGRTMDLEFLMEKVDGQNKVYGKSFADYLGERQLSPEQAFAAWLHHDHYIWNSARPRTAHGTVELRAPCQQPWSEHMAAAALGAGIVQAHQDIAKFLQQELGDEMWSAMSAWHKPAITDGLASQAPTSGLIQGVLERCVAGLEARGLGEEVYLEPLFARLSAGENPAQRSRRLFAEGGLSALLEDAVIS